MPNMIQLPIINSGPTALQPRFKLPKLLTDVYAVSKADSSSGEAEVIHVHYAKLAVASDTAPL